MAQEDRQFDKEKLEAYSDDPELQYGQDYHHSDSFYAIALAYLFSKLAVIFGSPSLQWMMPIFFRLLLIASIILSIVLILRLKYGRVWAKRSRQFYHSTVHVVENEKEDYEQLLQESLANNHHKLTVRYLFLCTLGTLSRQKVIALATWKAPFDYLREIPEEKQNMFKLLTDLFENTWYGDYTPDNEAIDKGMQWYRQLINA